MAEVVITFDKSDVDKVFAALAKASFRNRLLRAVGGMAERQTKRRFGEKVSPDGVPWAPWSASYAGGKSQKGRGILVRTGRLMGSIANFVAGDAVTVGSGVAYGRYHQFGTKKMVARPWLGASAANLTEIEGTLVKFIKAVVG
ncbi:phage virion morphogenesis protein [Mesorhizobium sp. Cs1299R1N3]|uniref:phage virion morphogenesis protein n=1 Tax=Mesorhizobium sp. Cs1299R1N3 TaxID=3015173 RepID=UPI00301B713C